MPKGSSKDTETPNFVISNSNLQLKKDIVNIADNLGTSMSKLVRKMIIQLRDSYSTEMRQPKPKG